MSTNKAAAPAADEKKPVLKIAEATEQKKEDLPPLENRLLRLNQLFDLQTKYNRLDASLLKLNQFELGKDEEKINLTIGSSTYRNDDSFSTNNPAIIGEVLIFLRKIINERKKELEPKLTW